MIALLCFVLNVLVSPFKSTSRLEAENAALRHQVVMLRRIHGRAAWTAKSGLAHISAQPRAGHCRDGSIHCPDHWLQPALCLRRCSAGPERAGLDQRYTKSYDKMDRAPDNPAIPLQ